MKTASPSEPIGGSIMAGLTLLLRSPYLLGIGLFVVLLASVSTFLYFEQAELVAKAVPDPVQQTRLFSAIDAVVQALTLVVQLLMTARLARRMGVTILLTAIPILMVVGFGLLTVAAALPMLLVVVILRRVGEYALARPGREMLFTRVGLEERYKAKNVIDTVVYRGGDAASAGLRTAVELGRRVNRLSPERRLPRRGHWSATGSAADSTGVRQPPYRQQSVRPADVEPAELHRRRRGRVRNAGSRARPAA